MISWKVWIGDLGYVLTDEQYRRVHSECSWNRWDNKFVDNEYIGNPLSIDEIEDDEEEDEESDPGIPFRKCFLLETWKGDGRFKDEDGNVYPVDSGQIGMMLLEDIDDSIEKSKIDLGHIHEVYNWDCFFREGVLYFGNGDIRIDTCPHIKKGEDDVHIYDDEEDEDEE